MKYYSIARIETHGIEEFDWPSHRGWFTTYHVYDEDGSTHTERIGVDCFRSRKQALKAAREKLSDEIILCDTRRYRLEERLRELGKA